MHVATSQRMRLAIPALVVVSIGLASVANAASSSAPYLSPRTNSSPRTIQGGPDDMSTYALEHSPALTGRAAAWRAARQQIDAAGRLPNPVVSYGLFLRRVETRVGSQRQRVGVSQAFPWPSVLSADVDAARSTAKSRKEAYAATKLEVARVATNAYWDLWALQGIIQVQKAHVPIVKQLLTMVAAHLEVGHSTLADHGRVAISLSRLTDQISGLEQRAVRAEANLVAVMGATASTHVRVASALPEIREVVDSFDTLDGRAQQHPRFKLLGWAAEAKAQRARQADASRYPSFVVGVDYIDTAASDVAVVDNGKDPILLKIGVQIPLWQGSFQAAAAQRRAEQAEVLARIASLRQTTEGALRGYLSQVEDSTRRVALYKKTLIPQAESVFSSTIASYQTGRSTISDVLLAWGDLIQLQSALIQARAEHAKSWANLRAIVGAPIRSRLRKDLSSP